MTSKNRVKSNCDVKANFSLVFLNDTHLEELDLVQKFIEIQGWLLLRFFICLHNQLSSFNSIIVQMSEKRDSSVDSKNQRDQRVFM